MYFSGSHQNVNFYFEKIILSVQKGREVVLLESLGENNVVFVKAFEKND